MKAAELLHKVTSIHVEARRATTATTIRNQDVLDQRMWNAFDSGSPAAPPENITINIVKRYLSGRRLGKNPEICLQHCREKSVKKSKLLKKRELLDLRDGFTRQLRANLGKRL